MSVHEAIAQCFAAEGVKTHYRRMGYGNMNRMAVMGAPPSKRTLTVRHEHCALQMAVVHWNATSASDVCSVTHGPGITQLATGIATAAPNHAGVVIFAGETGLCEAHVFQEIDQAPIARVFDRSSAIVTDSAARPDLFSQYQANDRARRWDVKISYLQQLPPMCAGLARKGA